MSTVKSGGVRTTLIIAQRELAAYFATPVATVFIVIFLALQGALTFNLGNFFDRGQAEFRPHAVKVVQAIKNVLNHDQFAGRCEHRLHLQDAELLFCPTRQVDQAAG